MDFHGGIRTLTLHIQALFHLVGAWTSRMGFASTPRRATLQLKDGRPSAAIYVGERTDHHRPEA